MGEQRGSLILDILLVSLVSFSSGLNIWPLPQSVSHGVQTLYLSKDFELKTEGSNYADASGILKDAFSRLLDVMKTTHVVDANSTYYKTSSTLKGYLIFKPSTWSGSWLCTHGRESLGNQMKNLIYTGDPTRIFLSSQRWCNIAQAT